MSDEAVAFTSLLVQLSRLVKKLSVDQVSQIISGDTKLIFLQKGHKVVAPLDMQEVAAEVRRLGSQDEVIRRLEGDKRLTGPVLRQLATELSISLPPAAKTKPAIQLHIAQSAAGYRLRTYGGF